MDAKIWIGWITVALTGVGGSFTAGKYYAESQSDSKELKVTIKNLQNLNDSLHSQVNNLKATNQDIALQLQDQKNLLAQYQQRLSTSNNCIFVQKQLERIGSQIESKRSELSLFGYKDTAREEISILQKQYDGLQQSLSTCNK